MTVHLCRYCARIAVGKLDVQVGGLAYKLGRFWLWDGLHLAWGDHVARLWWNSRDGAHVERAYEPIPEIPNPPTANDGHPELTCRRCGGPNVSWSAPSPLWNAVMRGGSINGPWEFDELICPTCFCVLAEQRGVAVGWTVAAKVVHVELETVTPSGRTWDVAAQLWRPVSASKRPTAEAAPRRYPINQGDPMTNNTMIVTCGACGGRGGTYGPGHLPDGRKVDSGMWDPCAQCNSGPAGPGQVIVCAPPETAGNAR